MSHVPANHNAEPQTSTLTRSGKSWLWCSFYDVGRGNYEVCITANQHTSLSIMSTDDLRIVVGPATKIVVEGSLLHIVWESAVMLLYVTKFQINASCWNCTTINSGPGVYWKGCGWDEGYLCWYESVPVVRHSFCRSIACE